MVHFMVLTKYGEIMKIIRKWLHKNRIINFELSTFMIKHYSRVKNYVEFSFFI